MWELEERHLQEKHQQLKQQLKDQYFMQRHQLLKRHEKVSSDTASPRRVPVSLAIAPRSLASPELRPLNLDTGDQCAIGETWRPD